MLTLRTPAEMKIAAAAHAAAGRRIALIATMGNLHAGQASLIAAAKARADVVVVSIFANPLEFGPNDNLAAYPRDLPVDLAFAEAAGADIAFCPGAEDMHPQGHATTIEESVRSRRLCGVSRPTHFKGFLTNFVKLLHCVRPQLTLFGFKDLQQAAVVRQAVRDLFLDVEVEVCPTVREADGLALSWRNRLLSTIQRAEASTIPVALERARQLVQQGSRSTDRIVAGTMEVLSSKRMIRVIYAHCIDPETTEPAREIIPGSTVLALSVWVGETRLLDDTVL